MCWNNKTYLQPWQKMAALALLDWDKHSLREAAERHLHSASKEIKTKSRDLLIFFQIKTYWDINGMRNDERYELDMLWDITTSRGLIDDPRPVDPFRRRLQAPPEF